MTRLFFALIPSLWAIFAATAADTTPPWSPDSYPDARGFKQRKQILLGGIARGGLDKWRTGYFAGGDPGKYLPLHAMAKLQLDPEDAEAAKYMNDNRSYKEHYHFAVVNWARFWPLYGKTVLSEETREKFIALQKKRNYLNPTGTENHKVMWWSSALVLPYYTGVGTDYKSKDKALAIGKEILRSYVKGLYSAGQGEWDSSTYLMFDVNGLLNIYDFSKDPECQLMARAALDYLIASYALKYCDGAYTGPNQRGYAKGPYRSIADKTGYLWWAGNKELTEEDTTGARYTIHPITSNWRPGRVLYNIATRNLKGLPVEQRNAKANYWHGPGVEPRAGASHETLYIHPNFTMGSLWDQHQSQHTRFQIAVSTAEGAVVFNGGHPRKSDHTGKKTGIGFADGTGRYVQSVQSGPVYLCMVRAPEEESETYAYFSFPESNSLRTTGNWVVLDVGDIHLALRSLGGKIELGTTPPDKKGRTKPLLKMPGRNTGFALWVLDKDKDLWARLDKVELDTTQWEPDGTVRLRIEDVCDVEATFNPAPEGDNHGVRAARATVNGKPIDLESWPIFGGPFVKQEPGVVTISDGKERYLIDFTGDLPVYKEVKVASD